MDEALVWHVLLFMLQIIQDFCVLRPLADEGWIPEDTGNRSGGLIGLVPCSIKRPHRLPADTED